MDLRCKTPSCKGKKLGEATAPSHVEIKCPKCKEFNTFILTINEENQTANEQQSFIKNNYEKTAVTYRHSA